MPGTSVRLLRVTENKISNSLGGFGGGIDNRIQHFIDKYSQHQSTGIALDEIEIISETN